MALKLYQEHFTFLSSDPEVRRRTEESLRRDLTSLSVQDEERDSTETELEEEEGHKSDRSKANNEDDQIENIEEISRKTSTPNTRKQHPTGEDMFKKLLEHVDNYLESKLSSIGSERRGEESLQHAEVSEGEDIVRKRNKKKIRKDKHDSYQRKMEKNKGKSKRNRQLESESESTSSSEDSSSEEESDRPKTMKRRPRSVADWKMKYDGKDEGRKLNKFIAEVEFMAEAENLGKRDLFTEAIHLFSGEARTWYIEGKKNRDFRKWRELVAELKLEFQPPDMDFHYEQQAAQRRQKRSEKFQDYFNAVMEIFQYMAVCPSEQRMFDIIFRNLRSDYKNVLVVKGIRSLKALKQWGRKLDSANVWMYRSRDADGVPRAAQVHEVSGDHFRKTSKPAEKGWKPASPQFKGSRLDIKQNIGTPKPYIPKKPDFTKNDARQGSSRGDLESRVANYRIPDKLVCFNCRGKYHHFNACLLEKAIFCTVCGFHDFTKSRCPFCTKNGPTSA